MTSDGVGGAEDSGSETSASCESGSPTEWYPDDDGDGFGAEGAEPVEACSKPNGEVVDNAEDCDDSDGTVHPGADETCDGDDENCNGTPDQMEPSSVLTSQSCQETEGVCSGATIASCKSSGEGYASCGADQYGDAYRADDAEGWRCDAKDNDCDGTVDEACCGAAGNPATPSPVAIGNDVDDQKRPIVLPAIGGGPDAAFLVVWAEFDTFKLQYVDRSGATVDAAQSNVGGEISELDAVVADGGYAIAVSYTPQFGGKVELFRYDADLGQRQPFLSSIDASNPSDPVDNVAAAVDGSDVWVTYAFFNDQYVEVRVAAVDASNGSEKISPITLLSEQSGPVRAPEVAIVDGDPVVVWWDGGIEGARIENGSVTKEFEIPAGSSGADSAEPIEWVGGSPEGTLIYPDFVGGGDSQLRLRKVGASATGSLGEGRAITGSSSKHRLPSAAAVDVDGSGGADRLLLSWTRGQESDPAVVGGSLELGSAGTVDAKILREIGEEATTPEVGVSEGLGAVVWATRADDNDGDVEYAPMSIDGVAVCPSSSSN